MSTRTQRSRRRKIERRKRRRKGATLTPEQMDIAYRIFDEWMHGRVRGRLARVIEEALNPVRPGQELVTYGTGTAWWMDASGNLVMVDVIPTTT